jgi:predicted metal-dependent HD superfamily phosphohydrolase
MSPEGSLAMLGLPGTVTDRWQAQLAEPHRHYHDRRHIAAMLAAIPPGRESRELIAAIWLHDVVYDPRAGDNEERSAEQARRDLAVSDIDAGRVAALILGTKHHRADMEEQQLLNDLDLGILGASPDAYARYAADIRREYAHVAEEAYRAGRARVLRGFLELPAIYGGADFRHLEEPARANLAGEIARWAA